MKKLVSLMVSLVLLFSVALAPAWAGGGKNQGDVGRGTVDQGDSGSEDSSPGSDAMGNQVD